MALSSEISATATFAEYPASVGSLLLFRRSQPTTSTNAPNAFPTIPHQVQAVKIVALNTSQSSWQMLKRRIGGEKPARSYRGSPRPAIACITLGQRATPADYAWNEYRRTKPAAGSGCQGYRARKDWEPRTCGAHSLAASSLLLRVAHGSRGISDRHEKHRSPGDAQKLDHGTSHENVGDLSGFSPRGSGLKGFGARQFGCRSPGS